MARRRNPSDDPALKPVASEILDAFVEDGPLSAQDIEAAMRRFKKALIERALHGELTHHLGYPPASPALTTRSSRSMRAA
jgi:transposase-like protein